MTFIEVVETVGTVIDGTGVAIIAIGAVMAAGFAIGRLRRKESDTYEKLRQQLGRSILLGLELLVAADIIRTVAVTPTAQSVAVLAGIVLIRTFLSWSLELEISGRWPWQKKRPAAVEPPKPPDR
ncbi:membrane protein [Mycolicibacterium canariasense]|uniref:Membrane protein n=1 Tax=Mycolicibacterium canariasense TaxID=228230 RepID=A0A124E234_MYCCR|nr:DUF1622 domain-containing protein [Mycolicibacterium canariasense]MCV7212570.1 DUF1622 domain-containing protein [Mycolicibacterium canariasense]ORV05368.1 hypothetical protein AWB94_19990 [Mycolicibacterium canariasense]GAS95569.1 membrane protein [Mycolicibacterium canariasense]